MALIPQHPDAYTEMLPQQEETICPEKSKAGSSNVSMRRLSAEKVQILELNFQNDQTLDLQQRNRLASELGLDPRQVTVWFQNRRTRWKYKKLEEDNYRLQSEVLKLKEQLSEAEKEIQRLSKSELVRDQD